MENYNSLLDRWAENINVPRSYYENGAKLRSIYRKLSGSEEIKADYVKAIYLYLEAEPIEMADYYQGIAYAYNPDIEMIGGSWLATIVSLTNPA
jgi:hypothetical protein